MEKKRKSKGKGKSSGMLVTLESHAAGVDIGAEEIYVAVPPDRDEHPVRASRIIALAQPCKRRVHARIAVRDELRYVSVRHPFLWCGWNRRFGLGSQREDVCSSRLSPATRSRSLG